MIRGPARRFVSGYANRVFHYRELSARAAGKALDRKGFAPDPDLASFAGKFRAYLACYRTIARHFLPQLTAADWSFEIHPRYGNDETDVAARFWVCASVH